MAKAKYISGYDARVTEACERVLVTLLRHLGPWRKSVFLIGGLTPRYLIDARPPEVPAHAGTADVDIVVDIAMLTDTEAYRTLESNLREMNFHRAVNEDGVKQSWRWQTDVDGATMILEFLVDDPSRDGGRAEVLPIEGKVSAINIPRSSMVVDFHKTRELKAELLDGKGVAVETVRFADIVSFTCLKSLAYDDRIEPKDAHDLVYCLEHYPGGVEEVVEEFRRGLDTKHRDVILDALGRLSKRFRDSDPDQSYRLDGPVAVAAFEDNDAGIGDDEGARDGRILRQRRAADVVAQLLGPIIG